jgi:hypothetical protein
LRRPRACEAPQSSRTGTRASASITDGVR